MPNDFKTQRDYIMIYHTAFVDALITVIAERACQHYYAVHHSPHALPFTSQIFIYAGLPLHLQGFAEDLISDEKPHHSRHYALVPDVRGKLACWIVQNRMGLDGIPGDTKEKFSRKYKRKAMSTWYEDCFRWMFGIDVHEARDTHLGITRVEVKKEPEGSNAGADEDEPMPVKKFRKVSIRKTLRTSKAASNAVAKDSTIIPSATVAQKMKGGRKRKIIDTKVKKSK
ncbi:hypothetical protein M430DRAFT_17487 [Amorphotheca resinae ATCC 22711]|jgi:hypothetical protein|uniref:Uncharacterized protein n=1 Tax=Amorphotheca resinae ATCC 22711 TaxID=857342 RepID=A0A2T3B586_AMORE|nr:hypothetical protein M430DRAFT_17487 [Amorphotheca resinae ATCC 22711]PSS21917.1 hypothetical protein M430DRAFT_17487 [Amorphotheca resinae ATCC 22711]